MSRSGSQTSLRFSFFGVLATCVLLAGCGSSENTDKAKQELAAARATIQTEKAAAEKGAQQTKDEAQQEVEDAKQEVADEKAKLDDLKRKTSKASHKLKRLQKEVSGASAAVARGTVDGEGTYVVGQDIDPGTYRADASPGCYWARLSSLDTSDILDNDNADGPVVIEVLPTDKALTLSGCAQFHKSG